MVTDSTGKSEKHHHNTSNESHQYCPKCAGSLTRRVIKTNEPGRLICSICSFIFYDDPKIAACTIPTANGKILLLKRGIEPGFGKWVFPGGFLDRGERVQDAAIRETLEETGIKVEVGHLLNAYSYKGYPVVVMVYPAKILEGVPQPLDETLEVAFFGPKEIPWEDLAFPSTNDALHEYLSTAGRLE